MRSSRSVRQSAFCVCRTAHFHRPLRSTNHRPSISPNRETRVAQKTTAKITARREKIRMECLGKTCRATAPSAARRNTLCFAASLCRARSWSWRRESNPRPSDYKSDALPTELRQQNSGEDMPSPELIPLILARCPGQLFKVSQGQVSAQPRPPGKATAGLSLFFPALLFPQRHHRIHSHCPPCW